MLNTIVTIILKYWVEFLLSALVACGGFFLRRYLQLERQERQRSQDEHYKQLTDKIQEENKTLISSLAKEHEEINKRSSESYCQLTSQMNKALELTRKESQDEDEKLQKQINYIEEELGIIKGGMLSMQGKDFRAECRKLLDEKHEITIDEWEELDADHNVYNSLGGNHKGDYLFSLVEKKFEKNVK